MGLPSRRKHLKRQAHPAPLPLLSTTYPVAVPKLKTSLIDSAGVRLPEKRMSHDAALSDGRCPRTIKT